MGAGAHDDEVSATRQLSQDVNRVAQHSLTPNAQQGISRPHVRDGSGDQSLGQRSRAISKTTGRSHADANLGPVIGVHDDEFGAA
jgi:hypothetical protein